MHKSLNLSVIAFLRDGIVNAMARVILNEHHSYTAERRVYRVHLRQYIDTITVFVHHFRYAVDLT